MPDLPEQSDPDEFVPRPYPAPVPHIQTKKEHDGPEYKEVRRLANKGCARGQERYIYTRTYELRPFKTGPDLIWRQPKEVQTNRWEDEENRMKMRALIEKRNAQDRECWLQEREWKEPGFRAAYIKRKRLERKAYQEALSRPYEAFKRQERLAKAKANEKAKAEA